MTEVTRPLPGPDDESRPPAGAPTAPRVNVTRLVAEAASKSGLLWIRLPDGATHPAWHVWTPEASWFHGPAINLYGPDFAAVLATPPRSAFVAVGSEIAVHHGRRLMAAPGHR